MKKHHHLLAAATAGIMTLWIAPGLAHASRATYGSNYSEAIYDIAYTMRACDMESDSRHVYFDHQIGTGEWSSVTDGDGANNSRNDRGSYPDIIQHRACEAIDFAPDACGSWRYP